MTDTKIAEAATELAFTASAELADNLQKVHVDLIELHVQGKQAHWNVVGHNFRDLHLQLDELVESAREFSDEISERMRAIYVTPDGRASTIAKTTSIAEFPGGEVDTAETVDLIVPAVYAVAGTIREVHDDVDEADPTTADLLHGFLVRLEQLAWMIEAENRVANQTTPKPIHE
jgi:starvation-inducible DNA-binding protein